MLIYMMMIVMIMIGKNDLLRRSVVIIIVVSLIHPFDCIRLMIISRVLQIEIRLKYKTREDERNQLRTSIGNT